MKFLKQLSILFITITIITFNPLDSSAEFYNGNDLVKDMQEYEKVGRGDKNTNCVSDGMYMGYITGVYDATHGSYDAPEGLIVKQLCSIVAKYLNEHPERWSEPAASLVIDAIRKAYPKKKKRK